MRKLLTSPAWLGISGLVAVLTLLFGVFAWRYPQSLPTPIRVVVETAQAVTGTNGADQTGSGTTLGQYDIDLPEEYGINFGRGERPQPIRSGFAANDLAFDCCNRLSSTGQLALLESSSPSYSGCKSDTRYTNHIDNPAIGSIVCFSGHNLLAAVQVRQKGDTGGGTSFMTLSVVVWQGS
jgi:hypothetical protein